MSTASKSHSPFAKPLLTLFSAGTAVGLSDGELLQRFASRQGDSAEMAFAVLVERHGAMVLRVCRSVTGDRSEAEDAFQSTFLILARKARTVRVDETLAPWLYGVARKVSARAVASTQRRKRFVERFAEWTSKSSTTHSAPDDSAALIREELARLPHRYQAAVRLCDLDGFAQEEAAELLRLPLGTIKSRLSRGRAKLREALVRRGFSATCVWSVPQGVSTLTLPPQLASLAVRAALYESEGTLAAGALISSTVIALTEGSMQAMFMTKVKVAVCLAIGAGVVGGGTWVRSGNGVAFGAFRQEPTASATANEVAKAGTPTSDSSSTPPPTAIVKPTVAAKSGNGAIAVDNNQEPSTAKKEIDLALSDLKRAVDRLDWSNQMFSKGYIAKEQNKSESLELDRAILALTQSMSKLKLTDAASTKPEASPPSQVVPAAEKETVNSDLNHQIAVARTKLAAKKGALNRAKAQESLASSVVAMKERLKKRNAANVSLEELEKATAEVNVTKAGVEIAEAEFQESQLELGRLEGPLVTSPKPPIQPERSNAEPTTTIDDLKHQLAINQAHLLAKKGALRRAQAQADQAKGVFKNYEKLKANQAISAEEFQKSKSDVDIAAGGVDIAEAELQESQLEVDRSAAMIKKGEEGKPSTTPSASSNPEQGESRSKVEQHITVLEAKLDKVLELLTLTAKQVLTER